MAVDDQPTPMGGLADTSCLAGPLLRPGVCWGVGGGGAQPPNPATVPCVFRSSAALVTCLCGSSQWVLGWERHADHFQQQAGLTTDMALDTGRTTVPNHPAPAHCIALRTSFAAESTH